MKRIGIVLGLLFVVCLFLFKIETQGRELAEWRAANAPVFASRGSVDITNRATPRDLACYLDKNCPVVWQEWTKFRMLEVKEVLVTYNALGIEVARRDLTKEEQAALDYF